MDGVTISPQAFLKMSPEDRALTIQTEYPGGCLRKPPTDAHDCYKKARPIADFLKSFPPPVQAGVLIGVPPRLRGALFQWMYEEGAPEEVVTLFLQVPPFEMFTVPLLLARLPPTKREVVFGLLEKESHDNAWRLLDVWEISFLTDPKIQKDAESSEEAEVIRTRASRKEVFDLALGKGGSIKGLAKKHGAPRPKPSGGEFSLPSRWSDYADLKIRFYLDPKRWSLSGRFLDRLSDRWLPFRYLAGADQIRIDGKAYAPTKPQRAIVEGKLFPHVRSQSPRR